MKQALKITLWTAGVLLYAAIQISAQQPQAPPNPQQQQIQKEAELVSARLQLIEQKLSGLDEFKQFEQLQAQFQQLQQQYNAAGRNQPQSKTEAKPAQSPAKK